MIFPKKPQILYAPMLSSFGGGSARGFGKNLGGASLEAITGSSLLFVNTYTGPSGTVYYKPQRNSGSGLEVIPGGVLYVAMVGGGGGAGRRTPGGNGGLGIAKITIPATDGAGTTISRLFFLRGDRGNYNAGTTGHSGGNEQGGSGGNSGGSYNNQTGASGAGVVGIQAGASSSSRELSHSGNNIHLAYVGSGGGGAHVGNADLSMGGGHGGGIGRNGLDGYYNGYSAGYKSYGGTTTAGGQHYHPEPVYTDQNATDGYALGGGNGGDSGYDGGGGGGAGYFGGGGGSGGGGYDGGPGGGGSGFAMSGSEIIFAAEATNSTPGTTLINALAAQTGDTASFFTSTVNIFTSQGAGMGRGTYTDGQDGEILVWN